MSESNEIWARRMAARWDSEWAPRWEVFDRHLERLAGRDRICLNIGSGVSEEFDRAERFKLAVDTDIQRPDPTPTRRAPFVQHDIRRLPFRSASVDLVLLRFIVEHLKDPKTAFEELYRVLKPGGQILILTTNLISPFILLPRLVPYRLREAVIGKLFRISSSDIFPTYHHCNTRKAVRKAAGGFDIIRWEYLQDANWTRRWLFVLFFIWHLKTGWFRLRSLRSNFICVLQRS